MDGSEEYVGGRFRPVEIGILSLFGGGRLDVTAIEIGGPASTTVLDPDPIAAQNRSLIAANVVGETAVSAFASPDPLAVFELDVAG